MRTHTGHVLRRYFYIKESMRNPLANKSNEVTSQLYQTNEREKHSSVDFSWCFGYFFFSTILKMSDYNVIERHLIIAVIKPDILDTT